MSDLAGKSVIVTGSSSGIGEATALVFARQGCHVTLCGRDPERLEVAVEKCRQAASGASGAAHTNRIISVPGDMTQKDVRHRVLEETVKAFGGIHVLVANHGLTRGGRFADLTEEQFDEVMNVNLKSYVFLIKDAVPYLEKTRGSIICVSSLYSTLAGTTMLPYYLSKAAMDHMVHCLALDLGPKGIRINAVRPSLIKTRIAEHLFSEPSHLYRLQDRYESCTPLAGQHSTVQQPAEAIAFLASNQAGYISGQSLAIDGALSCKGNPGNWPAAVQEKTSKI